ncbi:MAG: hypothetical protein C5B56_13185 [Proteobacteria bacterium]|nr:MAG: hypothetical protein C5B56_13185 [Pseudomonadota bacterium]
MSATLCASFQAKLDEQIERTEHLIGLLPSECLHATVPGSDWSAAMLLGHLLDCLAGFCAVLAAASPESLNHFTRLRDLPVNHACSAAEARSRIGVYQAHIREGFRTITDADLARLLPTVFVPQGETLLTLLLGNLEHLINHKHQLFVLLRGIGCPVATADLYCLRG